MNDVIRELDQYLSAPEQTSLRRAFAMWISKVLAPSKGLSLKNVDTESLSEVKAMLAERVKQWEKELEAKGFEKGIEEGIEEGMEKGREQGVNEGEYTLLKRLLEKRFGPLPTWALEKLNTADRPHLEHWGLQLLEASNLDDVFIEFTD